MDADFGEAIERLVWPRAALFGAALWHFTPLLDVETHAAQATTLLRARGVGACRNGCSCSEMRAC